MSAVALGLFALGFVDAFEVTRHLELNLRVIEAFERGPVILEASITNRGTKRVLLEELSHSSGYCVLWFPEEWNLQPRRPRLTCPLGDIPRSLDPGESLSHRLILHHDYASAFPAGRYHIEVFWAVDIQCRPQREGEHPWHVPTRLVAIPSRTFPVTISPATPANRYALAARLEAEFAALPPVSGKEDDRDRPFEELCGRVTHTSHKELIPLALRLLDRVPAHLRGKTYWVPSLDLVQMVFDADPAAAHRIFVDRLTASPPTVSPDLVFPNWSQPSWKLYSSLRELVRPLDPRFWNEPRWRRAQWTPHKQLLELVRWLPQSAPRILPEREFRLLAVAKDFWVRAWLYLYFRDRLTPDWSVAFLVEARRWANAAPNANAPKEIDHATDLFLTILSFDRKAGHKLLDVFAAGNQDNPVCKAAREKLAEHARREREREP